MPARSKTQQRLMAQAYGVRKFMDTKGKSGIDPKDIKSKYRETIVDLAKKMTKKSLKDYASTKHDDIPEMVESLYTQEGNQGDVPTIYPYLNPAANKPKKKTKSSKMQNLADYREYISKRK
jgi:hypothetical protein